MMSAFGKTYPRGDLAFDAHREVDDAPQSSSHTFLPIPRRMGTVSPSSSDALAFQPRPCQEVANSFFEEAIEASPMSVEIDVELSGNRLQHASSQGPAPECKMSRKGKPMSNVSPKAPKADGEKQPARRINRKKQSETSLALSEPSAPGLIDGTPKARKRGRKPKQKSRDSDSKDELEDDEEEGSSKDPRRRRILERNRIAATKCRLRKRDEASALAASEEAMQARNRYLSSCFDSLSAEIYQLKTELLRHTDCNCVLIQKYISNEAKKSVDGLLACSSSFRVLDRSLSPDRGGSSGTSTTDSLPIQTPEMENDPSGWATPFHQGSDGSDAKDGVFDMGMETLPLLPDSKAFAQGIPDMGFSGYGPGLYVDMGPQYHHPSEVAWNSPWGYP
ncbi:hypothetical protein G7046_g7414 [Stylonectria norvegica]|nr:hypothetical protein G7046_g7414 [Stylonectria norvegica]